VDPGVGLDGLIKRKIPSPAIIRTPDYPARNPALYHWDSVALQFVLMKVPVIATWRVLGFRLEETASRYGG